MRYNSQIEKYQTRPCTLQEFLAECRQQNIIPFLGRAQDANVIAIADKYMGEGNYIAYGATRATCPHGIIYHWISNLTTAEDILAYCENIGKPFIFGLGNVSSISDATLKEIVDTLHQNGYWIGTSYADRLWYKYSDMGFDFNGTQTCINRIDEGNLCNLDTIFGFDAFTYDSSGTETDGVLTFASDGNIRPKIDDTIYPVCGVDIEMWFNGSIALNIGEFGNTTFTSDGSFPVFVATPIFNGSPKCTLTAGSGTVVYDIKYKASVF